MDQQHSFMAVALQIHSRLLEQAELLGSVGLHSHYTGDSLTKALEDIVHETWKQDISNVAGITTDEASNIEKEAFTWAPCFGHLHLHLANNHCQTVGGEAEVLSRIRKSVSLFTRWSPKMSRRFKIKQDSLELKDHRLSHDEPTHWD